jgi:cupin fold WbuC family metalloprotein
MKGWRKINSAVYYTASATDGLDDEAVRFLQGELPASPLRRTRVCTHSDPDDLLHEMMIVLDRSGYVRPHRHPGKAESLHVLEGHAKLVLFDDDGSLRKIVSLRPYGEGGVWYYRIADPVFHTLLIESESFTFHETTTGPFSADSSEFASWAPAPEDLTAADAYVKTLWEQSEA